MSANGAGRLCADDTAQPLLRGGLLGVAGKTGAGVGLAGSTFAGAGVGFGVGGIAGSVGGGVAGSGLAGSTGVGFTGLAGSTGVGFTGLAVVVIGVQYILDACGPWQVPALPSNVHGAPAEEPIQMARAGSIGPISARATCPESKRVETIAPSVSANF